MIRALISDMAQRIITADKIQQKGILHSHCSALNLPASGKVLDFGCGTGLFARSLRTYGLSYYGYDIDDHIIRYARRLYADCEFTTSKREIEQAAPFDLILANCCFHHIADDQLVTELRFIKSVLQPEGTFLFVDILAVENDPSTLHRLFMKMERGLFVRSEHDYRRLLETEFRVKSQAVHRSCLFSMNSDSFPIYNLLLYLECE